MFGGDGDGAICASNDGTFVVKGIVFTEVDDETGVFGTGGESDGGADLNAERFVGFCVGDTRFRGGVVASAAPDIDGARLVSGAASAELGANDCGIGRGAKVIFDFLLALANNGTSREKRQDERTEGSCRIAINFHSAPRALGMGNREPRAPASKLCRQAIRTLERVKWFYSRGVPALFQSIMLTSFQGFLRSWNSSWPSLLITSWAAG